MSKNLVNTMREVLIEARTKEEQKIDDFAKALTSVNIEEVFGDTYIPPIISLKSLCPEAYENEPNYIKYEEQYNKMVEIFTNINNKIIAYNEEALECLQQYKMIS
jgi:hypothetical protein